MNRTFLSEKILLEYILDEDIFIKENKFYCNIIEDYGQYYYRNGNIIIIDFAGVRTYYNRFLWIWYNKRAIPTGYSVIFKDNNKNNIDKQNITLTNKNPLLIGKEILVSKKEKKEHFIENIDNNLNLKQDNNEHKKIISTVFKNYDYDEKYNKLFLSRDGIICALKKCFLRKNNKKSFSDDTIIKFRNIILDVDIPLFEDYIQLASSLSSKNKKIIIDILMGNTYTWLNNKTTESIEKFKKYYHINNYNK